MATINVVKKRRTAILAGRNKLAFDYWMLLGTGALLVVGLLMVYSTTFDLGNRFEEDTVYFLRRQAIAMGIGIAAIVIIMQFDYHVFRIASVPLLLITGGVLFLMLLLGQVDDYGAIRTLRDGSYQPSEVAKLVSILYIAHWIHSKGDRIKQLNYGLIPFAVITAGLCGLIVRQPAVSTAILIALINFTMFLVAGADLKQVLIAGVLAGAAFVAIMLVLPHTSARVDAYVDGLRDPMQAHYQVQQALAALANGGVVGVGLGKGNQKFGPLPLSHTDGVFAIVGEELGLIGAVGVIVLMGFLVWRGLRTAMRAADGYGALLALGITVWIAYQTLINLAVITAVIPFTGMPMPFLSYGGSSMVMILVGVGILLNISRDGMDRPARRRLRTTSRQD